MKRFVLLLKTISRLLIISILIGFFVATFQYISSQLGLFLKDVFINKVPWKVIAFFIALPTIIACAYFSVKYNKNIIGGGIPALEYNLKYRKDKLNWRKDLPGMMFSALLTTCTYACLGTVLATSVIMGGNIALLVNEYFKEEDDDSVNISMGAAFGSMLLNPIPGIVYCFEESLKKFNFKLLIKSLFICIISFLVTHLVFNHKTFNIEINAYLDLSHWYIFIIIQIAAFLFSTTFVHLIVLIKNLSIKHPNNFFSKYRVVLFFIFMIPFAFIMGKYLGSGVSLIGDIFSEQIWYILVGVFVIRFILTILGIASSSTGGVIIPTFALGATFGMALTLVLNKLFNLPLDYAGEIVLLSILTFYVSTIETPFTGIALLFAFVNFKSALYLLVPTTIMMLIGRLLSRFNRYGDLYDVLKRYLK